MYSLGVDLARFRSSQGGLAMAVVTRSRGSSKLKPEPCVHPAAPARVQLTRPNFRRGAGRICIACARSLPSPWSAMRTDDPGTGTIPASATTFRRRAHGICAQKAREVTPPVRAGPCRPFPPRRATGQGGPVRLATRLLPLVVFKAAPDGRSASSCDWEPLPFWARAATAAPPPVRAPETTAPARRQW
jgi:hypothetical protein